MPGRSLGIGKRLAQLAILCLAALSGYLYFQVQSLKQEVVALQHLKGVKVHSKGIPESGSPFGNFNLTLPSGLASFGGKDITLIESARDNMQSAEQAASQGNFGTAAQESKQADADLSKAEAGASSQTRSAVAILRRQVAIVEKQTQVATQGIGN